MKRMVGYGMLAVFFGGWFVELAVSRGLWNALITFGVVIALMAFAGVAAWLIGSE